MCVETKGGERRIHILTVLFFLIQTNVAEVMGQIESITIQSIFVLQYHVVIL